MEHLQEVRRAHWAEVYDYFFASEYLKWAKAYGKRQAASWVAYARDVFRHCRWVHGTTRVDRLLYLRVYPGVEWVTALACAEHTGRGCRRCRARVPTFSDLQRNFARNAGLSGAKKVLEIVRALEEGLMVQPTVIVVDHPRLYHRPFVFDGNSRLAALAVWKKAHQPVFVYYGLGR